MPARKMPAAVQGDFPAGAQGGTPEQQPGRAPCRKPPSPRQKPSCFSGGKYTRRRRSKEWRGSFPPGRYRVTAGQDKLIPQARVALFLLPAGRKVAAGTLSEYTDRGRGSSPGRRWQPLAGERHQPHCSGFFFGGIGGVHDEFR